MAGATCLCSKKGMFDPQESEHGGPPPPSGLDRRVPRRTAQGLLLLALLAGFPWMLLAGEKNQIEPSAGYNANATVPRGGSCEIRLRAVPFGEAPVEFKVPKGPGRGSLSGPVRISQGTIAYTYTHDGSAAPATDSFAFRFKAGPRKSWATRTATIQIVEPTPALEAIPGRLDFGTVFVGSSAILPLRIRNSGGGELSASLQTSPPWSIPVGMAAISLAAGETLEIPVGFTPRDADTQKGSLFFKIGEGVERVPLGGAGRMRFSIQEKVSFDPVPGAPPVEIPVRNLSDQPLALELRAGKPLSCPPSLELAPNSGAVVRLAVENRHYTAESAKLTVSDGASTLEVRAALPPPPARLEWACTNATLDIGTIPLRHSVQTEAELRNTGAKPVVVSLREGSGGLRPGNGQPLEIEVPPGGSAKIRALWHPPEKPGPAGATLVASHGGTDHILRVVATVAPAPEAPKANPSPPPAPGRQSPAPGRRPLEKNEAAEIRRSVPAGIAYRLEPGRGNATAVVSWTRPVGPSAGFRVLVLRQRPLGLLAPDPVPKRLQLPGEIPEPTPGMEWTPVPGTPESIVQLPDGRWQCRIPGLAPGFHAVRIIALDAGKKQAYGAEIPIFVGRIPSPPATRWILAALLAALALFLFRKRIPRLFAR